MAFQGRQFAWRGSGRNVPESEDVRNGAKSQQEVFADIGQGKRLSFVVAQALTNPATDAATREAMTKPAPITLRGVEGVAIQYAKCCRPIPGDGIVAVFHPGQGLVVHTADCMTLRKTRPEQEQMLDVTWDSSAASLEVTVQYRPAGSADSRVVKFQRSGQ